MNTKKLLNLSLFGLLITILSCASIYSMSGTGTYLDPYVLESCADLKGFDINEKANFSLTQDIDCSGYLWNSSGHDSINGTLDGNFHTIKNLVINWETAGNKSYIWEKLNNATLKNIIFRNITLINNSNYLSSDSGLIFGNIGAVSGKPSKIENIRLENINMSATSEKISKIRYCGILAGYHTSTGVDLINVSLINSRMECTERIGLLLGGYQAHTVKNLFVENSWIDTTKGTSHYGNYAGLIFEGCKYATMDLSSTTVQNSGFILNLSQGQMTYIGGLCGDYASPSRITELAMINNSINCSLASATYCGQVMGQCSGSNFNNAFFEDIGTQYWHNDFGGNGCDSAFNSVFAKPHEFFTNQSNYNISVWDFDNYWIMQPLPIPSYYQIVCDMALFWDKIINNIGELTISEGTTYEFIKNYWDFSYYVNTSRTINSISTIITGNSGIIDNQTQLTPYNISINATSDLFQDNPFTLYLSVDYDNYCSDSVETTIKVNDSLTPSLNLTGNITINENQTPYLWSIKWNTSDYSDYQINFSCLVFNASWWVYDGFAEYSTSPEIEENTTCQISVLDNWGNYDQKSVFIEVIPEPIIPPEDNQTGTTIVNNNVDLTGIENILLKLGIFAFWIVSLYSTLTLKGEKGQTIQFLNILQLTLGFISSMLWINTFLLLGLPLLFISLGFFLGLILYKK